ncbi:MAG: glycosyltransferase family 4 protein [Roseiflexaceae bacterium]
MHIAILNYIYDAEYTTVDALLERYLSLTGWADSLLAAGAQRVTVLQRFDRDMDLRRDGVEYLLRRGAGANRRSWSDPRRLHRAVAALRPDVAHVNGLIFPAQTWLLRRVLPRESALIVQDHGGPPPAPRNAGGLLRPWRRLRFEIRQAGLRAADGFMFTTAAQAQPWRAAGLIGPRQPVYEVIESGRPLRPLPQAQARAASGLRGDPALLWVGHLDANKDPLTVLAGFERALPQLPSARLTMVYLGEALLPAVQACLAASPALAERVELRGHVPYDLVAAYFSAADIFVLGSHREGSGYALIEALTCGAVPVVTDIPSFRALTAGGSGEIGAACGALWPPGDAEALAAALVEIGRRDLAPLRERLIAYAARELSWSAIGRRALDVYRDVLARRGDKMTR